LGFHERNQRARDKGKGDKDRREHDRQGRKNDASEAPGEDERPPVSRKATPVQRERVGPSPVRSPRAEHATTAKQQDEDEARDNRRYRKRQVDQRDQKGAALEPEFCH